MTKYQQRQIKELLNTIREAQEAEQYAGCQEGVQICSDFIDSIAGENTETVKHLTSYYELLFRVHSGDADKNALAKLLQQIEGSVAKELKPNRIEAAFLSYKASMSDSLESIYLAAKEDLNCEAFWIPIPYSEKSPPCDMHYEGAAHYGDRVDCTDFREYDIEARRPDVVFVFNPYDSNNLVTSVHKDYYCEKLRNYTDLLVYVPYWTSGDSIVEYEAFCVLPGTFYAHRVILESDMVRDFYIRNYEKLVKDNSCNIEEKFVALGSPKYDKVINTRREDCRLPSEWQDLIGNRQVVLYNTTVASIISKEFTTAQLLDKLRSVFRTFEHRDDMVLWWRPHPLSEAVFKTMKASMLLEYKEIVCKYRSDGFGIYDDTADLHRAIAWSDVHYGDENSVMRMFAVTGKPVFIQDSGTETNPWSANEGSIPRPAKEKQWTPVNINSLASNLDGTCGSKVWKYVSSELKRR